MVNLPGDAKSDVDLVVRLSNIDFAQFKATIETLLVTFHKLLQLHPVLGPTITEMYTTTYAVRFCVDARLRVDLLPTFELPPNFRVHDVPPADRRWYSVCFSKHQKKWVKHQAPSPYAEQYLNMLTYASYTQ